MRKIISCPPFTFPIHDVAIITGLNKRTDLNGKIVSILGFDPNSGRVKVRTINTTEVTEVKVKPSNLNRNHSQGLCVIASQQFIKQSGGSRYNVYFSYCSSDNRAKTMPLVLTGTYFSSHSIVVNDNGVIFAPIYKLTTHEIDDLRKTFINYFLVLIQKKLIDLSPTTLSTRIIMYYQKAEKSSQDSRVSIIRPFETIELGIEELVDKGYPIY